MHTRIVFEPHIFSLAHIWPQLVFGVHSSYIWCFIFFSPKNHHHYQIVFISIRRRSKKKLLSNSSMKFSKNGSKYITISMTEMKWTRPNAPDRIYYFIVLFCCCSWNDDDDDARSMIQDMMMMMMTTMDNRKIENI